MPIFEQNTPSGPLPQERQPSVHAVQLAFGPVANSSRRVPVSGVDVTDFDMSAPGCGCPVCRGMTARSAANVNSVPRPRSPVNTTRLAIAVRRSDIGFLSKFFLVAKASIRRFPREYNARNCARQPGMEGCQNCWVAVCPICNEDLSNADLPERAPPRNTRSKLRGVDPAWIHSGRMPAALMISCQRLLSVSI
jgi:hypothetical protein